MSACSFDPEKHEYRINGKLVPGVTQIIVGLGLVDTRYFTQAARDRGSAIHKAIEYHLDGDLHWPSVAEEFKPYVEAAILFVDDSKAKVESVETPLFNEVLGYGGMPDLIGTFFGDPGIPDWKTGGVDREAAGIQTALYDMAVSRAGSGQRRRFAIQLKKTGKYLLWDLSGRRGSRIDYQRATASVDLYRQFCFKGGPWS